MIVKFQFQVPVHYAGFLDINIYFNEYILKISVRKSWKCDDYGGKNDGGSSKDQCGGNYGYSYYFDRINFYDDKACFEGVYHKRKGGKWEQLYNFHFKIINLD